MIFPSRLQFQILESSQTLLHMLKKEAGKDGIVKKE